MTRNNNNLTYQKKNKIYTSMKSITTLALYDSTPDFVQRNIAFLQKSRYLKIV